MTAGKCRACNGTLKGLHSVGTNAQAAEIRIVARLPGKRRTGDFSLCPLCVSSVLTGKHDSDVAASLVTELRLLLQ